MLSVIYSITNTKYGAVIVISFTPSTVAALRSVGKEITMGDVSSTKYVATISVVTTTKNSDGSSKVDKDNFSNSTDDKAAFKAWLTSVNGAL